MGSPPARPRFPSSAPNVKTSPVMTWYYAKSDWPEIAVLGHAGSMLAELGTTDTMRYHLLMAMTLRLSDEQTEALRRKAEAEHRSMQQVALAAIDAYVHQATPARRKSVPVTELMTLFQDLPPMDAETFRAEHDRYADTEASFDAYERVGEPGDGE